MTVYHVEINKQTNKHTNCLTFFSSGTSATVASVSSSTHHVVKIIQIGGLGGGASEDGRRGCFQLLPLTPWFFGVKGSSIRIFSCQQFNPRSHGPPFFHIGLAVPTITVQHVRHHVPVLNGQTVVSFPFGTGDRMFSLLVQVQGMGRPKGPGTKITNKCAGFCFHFILTQENKQNKTIMDYNVDNYTLSELLSILEIDSEQTVDSALIMDRTNYYINQKGQTPQMVSFFQDMQTKLLQEYDGSGEDAFHPDNTQTNDWFKYEALPQNNDANQKNKNTDRKQKIDVYDNAHVPMNRQQLGINNNFNVKVAQDTLNPNLENVTKRFINLDSQFRQASGGSESMATDYTLDLSDPLTNVLSLSLYSIQIPYTWYAIDEAYNNDFLDVFNAGYLFTVTIGSGNYTPTEFCDELQNAFLSAGFAVGTGVSPVATFNSVNGKIQLDLNGWLDPRGQPIVGIDPSGLFDDILNPYYLFFGSSVFSCATTHTFNGTLGWLMGFRLPVQPIYTTGNIPVAPLSLHGTKYFILVLDDFNQNHINNGLITITELSKTLPLPSYYNTSQPYICVPNGLPSVLVPTFLGNLPSSTTFNQLQDKVDSGSGDIPQVVPSAPRLLTRAQIYTVNEIIKNRSKTTNYRAKAPTNADTFAIIPIKYGSMSTGDLYVELSGQFQDNKRIYFGPVNIDRMRIRLLNDRGDTVDLHGVDWSVTIISENLYQY